MTDNPPAKLHSSPVFRHIDLSINFAAFQSLAFYYNVPSIWSAINRMRGVLDTFQHCAESKAKKRFPIVRLTVSIGYMDSDI